MHLLANCSLECSPRKNAKESLKVWLAIKSAVKMHFKDAKKDTQQKVTLFFQVLFTKVKPTSRYDVTEHLRYDFTGLELTVWSETFS